MYFFLNIVTSHSDPVIQDMRYGELIRSVHLVSPLTKQTIMSRINLKKLKDYSSNHNQYYSDYFRASEHLHEIYESNFLSDS